MQLGRHKVGSTSTLLNPHTKMATMIWAPSGMGKTDLSGTLDAMTQKYFGKRSLIIGTEVGEGGGSMTHVKRGRDIPVITPANHNDLVDILASLKTDRQFGGVILDSSTEAAKRFAQPFAMAFPSREKKPTRAVGVPERSDYQTMGEIVRTYFQALINLTTDPNPELRKHVLILAADKIREDQESHTVTFWGPDLPGAMAESALQMLQTVLTLTVQREVKPGPDGKPVAKMRRYLQSAIDGPKRIKDRFNLMPASVKIRDFDDPKSDGMDLCDIWEQYWLPVLTKQQQAAAPAEVPLEP